MVHRHALIITDSHCKRLIPFSFPSNTSARERKAPVRNRLSLTSLVCAGLPEKDLSGFNNSFPVCLFLQLFRMSDAGSLFFPNDIRKIMQIYNQMP